MNKIITISREFGSGGRELGRRIADILQIAYYDQQIVNELAQKTDFTEKYIRQIEESNLIPLLPITIGRTFSSQFYQVMETNQSTFITQSNIIKEMAEKSDCVIVGRCADYLLRDKNPLRIFTYADKGFKMARCREKGEVACDLSERELIQKVNSIDKQRARYYQFHTGQTWGEKAVYDLCINTTSLEIKRLSTAIVKLIQNQIAPTDI